MPAAGLVSQPIDAQEEVPCRAAALVRVQRQDAIHHDLQRGRRTRHHRGIETRLQLLPE